MAKTIDLNQCDLYGGIAGIMPPPQPVDLGHGLTISATYAHLFHAKMMAFAPAPPKSPHPAPWAAVQGSDGVDIYCQLHVPRSFDPGPFFDHLNTIWWITALLRMRSVPHVFVPAISTAPFTKELAFTQDHYIFSQTESQRYWPVDLPDVLDEAATYDWIRRLWKSGGKLMRDSERFNTLVQAVDSSLSRPSAQLALIEIWGGLDQLFAEAPGEVRFKNSLRISSYLEPFGSARRELFGSIMQLYEKRSKAAHGGTAELSEALTGSYLLARRVILATIERGEVPTRNSLDKLTLGGDAI